MLHLLRIEWMKVKNYTTFWVLTILYVVSVFGATSIAHFFYNSLNIKDSKSKGINLQMFIGSLFDFPNVWHTITYAVSFLMFILGLIVIISMTNEYNYKTHRQNIIDGMSRSQFILVKTLWAFLISVAATVIVFITALIVGLREDSSFDFDQMEFIGYFFVQALNYAAAALLISTLFKKQGMTFVIYLLYCAIIERTMVFFLNTYVNKLGQYMPLESSNNLIRNPIVESFMKMANKELVSYNTGLLLLASVIYISLYCIISYRKFQRDDL